MKLNRKRGQAAVEYLQNYGFAILVVVIMGVALWQLGVFNIAPKVNVATGFKTIRVLEPSIKYIKKTGANPDDRVTNNFNFIITNTGGVYVHDLSLSVGGDCSYSVLGCSGTWFEKTTLSPSETTALGKICCNEYNPGDQFWVEVNITYTERVGEKRVEKQEIGRIQGFVE